MERVVPKITVFALIILLALFPLTTYAKQLPIPPPPMPPPIPIPTPPPLAQLQIEKSTGLFEYKGATHPVSAISPQLVTVLETYDDWLLIRTYMGPMWIYLNFTPPTDSLDTLLRRFPNTSIFFQNIETGFTYTWYADREFFGASLSKASYALYLYQRAERGEIDLNRTITFTAADWNGGSGVIRHRYSVGRTFTTRRLIELNLYESDNIATLMLRRIYGIQGYRQFVESLGNNPRRVRDRIMNSQLTPNEVGRFALAIWDYIASDGRYSEEFRNALLNNQFPFIVSDYPVASKTGWTSPIAWHDMSIVYAPSPYILVIMSARGGWTARDYSDFAEISMAFQNFNDRWFSQ